MASTSASDRGAKKKVKKASAKAAKARPSAASKAPSSSKKIKAKIDPKRSSPPSAKIPSSPPSAKIPSSPPSAKVPSSPPSKIPSPPLSAKSAAPPPAPKRPSSPPAKIASSALPAQRTVPPARPSAPIAAPPPSRASIPEPPPSMPAPPPSIRALDKPPAAPFTGPPRPEGTKKRGRPKGPFTQHRRLDALRALLQRHPKGLSIYDLARELGVTPRSMRRYLAEVRREIELVSATEKRGGPRLWRLAPNEVPRKIEIRRTQAYALLAARRLFEPMKGSTLYEEINLVAQKLFAVAQRPGRGPNAGVADARLEDRFLYLPFAPKDYAAHTDELDDLFQAVADLRPIRCKYRRARGSQEDKITIYPYAMVLYKDAIYCVGHHVQKNETRTFLLDRMRDTECAVTERFDLPENFRVDDYFQGQFGIFRGDSLREVVIDFDPRVAEYVRTRLVHPSQQLEDLPSGQTRMTMTIGDTTELATWILGFGETARVISPPDLVERVTKELRGALAHYEVDGRANEQNGRNERNDGNGESPRSRRDGSAQRDEGAPVEAS